MIKAATFQEYFQRYKNIALIALLVIFYTVGTVGLLSDKRADFLELSFLNLMISFVILLAARIKHNWKFYAFCITGFFIGMGAEWIGVHTGFLFGDYYYGPNLGPTWYGVPYIIGINWIMLTIISAAIADKTKFHWIMKALIGTALMVVLDVLIEPVAVASNYWIWNGEIPLSNFVGWFGTALLIQILYFALKQNEPNKVAIVLYFIQLTFFSIQNIF